jgi:uncharacterized protein
LESDARFCWTELATADPLKAGKFYARLLNWDRNPISIGTPSGRTLEYTLLSVGGQNVGGMYEMIRGQRLQGIESRWLPYIFVADARETGKRTEELGGKVLAPPVEVFDLGRLSILRDPQGIAFGAWQAARLDGGFQTRNQQGFACWCEHVSADATKAVRFYSALLRWSQRAVDGTRVVLEHGGTAVAGFSTSRPGGQPPQWVSFFQVADCAASCEKVASLSGTVLVPPVGANDAERHAVVSDSQGAVFGLFQPARSG